jgi:hypothetical protein
LLAPRLIGRFGRAALSDGAIVQLAGLAWLVAGIVTGWPHVSLLSMAAPLALGGAGQSMLFAGLFHSMLADVPAHLGRRWQRRADHPAARRGSTSVLSMPLWALAVPGSRA